MDRYITTKEFADLLKVSRQTILKFAKEGCPHISTNPGQQRTDYRWPMPEAEEWLAGRGKDAQERTKMMGLQGGFNG